MSGYEWSGKFGFEAMGNSLQMALESEPDYIAMGHSLAHVQFDTVYKSRMYNYSHYTPMPRTIL